MRSIQKSLDSIIIPRRMEQGISKFIFTEESDEIGM